MPKVVLLRAVNVGGHQTFRPSELAKDLAQYDIVNIGAAGTFVVRKSVAEEKLRKELLAKLGFATEVIIVDGKDLVKLAADDPFAKEPPGLVHFVTVLSKPARLSAELPIHFPSDSDWLLKVTISHDRFLCGTYKRHVKSIRYLGQVEKLAGVPCTTRNWNTIASIIRYLD